MKLAWNVKKNTVGSLKNLEREQNRDNANNRNKLIDTSKSHLNYELVRGSRDLTAKTLDLVEKSRENGSRIQKNSIVDLSNIITLSKEDAEKLGYEGTKYYFSSTVEFFQQEFGEENVTSAIVHLDESNPHMHLHVTPVNTENGKLQAHKVMTRGRVNKIHTELPKFLRERGFDVERGSSIEKDGTRKDYVRDINKLKQMTEDELILHENLVQKNQNMKLEQKEFEKTLDKTQDEIAEILKIKGHLEQEISSERETLEKEKETLKEALNAKNEYEREMQNLFNQKMALSDELDALKELVDDTKELAESVNTYKDGGYKIPLIRLQGDKYRPLNVFDKEIYSNFENEDFVNGMVEKGRIERSNNWLTFNVEVKTGKDKSRVFSQGQMYGMGLEGQNVENLVYVAPMHRDKLLDVISKDLDRFKRFNTSEFAEEVKSTLEKNDALQEKFEKQVQKRNRSNDFER